MVFYYDKTNGLFTKLFRHSNLKKLTYTPYVLTPTPFFQCVAYLLLEQLYRYFWPTSYKRELLQTTDGGTLGIDWVHFMPAVSSTKPILLCFPGVTLGNDNNYTKSLIMGVGDKYSCGVGLLRGAPKLPITSAKFNCSASYDDVKVIIDYVKKKYVKEESQRGFYAYGVSLGGILIGNYLWRAGEDTPLDAALLYSVP